MKTYTGTKTIKAQPMSRQEYNELRGWFVPADEDGSDAGYLVEYTDGGQTNVAGFGGYVSWSPKAVFERTYKEVGSTPKPPVPLNWKAVPDYRPGNQVLFRGVVHRIFALGDRPGTFDLCLPAALDGDRWLNVPPDQLSPAH